MASPWSVPAWSISRQRKVIHAPGARRRSKPELTDTRLAESLPSSAPELALLTGEVKSSDGKRLQAASLPGVRSAAPEPI